MQQETTFFTFSPTIAERDAAGLPKRFEGIAYSGGVIPDYGWYGDAAIDMSTLNLPTGPIFALVDHNYEERAGKLTATKVGNQIHVAGEFFTASDAGKEVAALFAEGAPWQMSVGIQSKATSYGDSKMPMTVNGHTLQINTLFTNATLREVSFVPVGADPSTAVAAFARRAADLRPAPGDLSSQEQNMSDDLTARVTELEGLLAAEKARADAADSALNAVKLSARKDAIKALGTDLGRELTADEAATFEKLDDATFTTMAATLRTFKPAPAANPANAHLFREQATNGANPDDEQTRTIKARAKIINQVSGKAA